jgi:transposase-like protein
MQNAGTAMALGGHSFTRFYDHIFQGGIVRKKWSDSQKKKFISDWKDSGLTRADFCKKIGVSLTGFDKWRRKFGSAEDIEREKQPKIEFLELSPISDGDKTISKVLRIVSSYGAVIEVPL